MLPFLSCFGHSSLSQRQKVCKMLRMGTKLILQPSWCPEKQSIHSGSLHFVTFFFNNFIPFCHLGFPLMAICLITTSNHMSWRTYLKVSGIFSLFKYFYLTFIQSWDFCTLYFAPKRNFQYVDVLVPLCRSHPVTLLFPLLNTSVSLQVPTQAIPFFAINEKKTQNMIIFTIHEVNLCP